MEIKERISTCLSALEQKRQTVDTFQARLRQLIDGIRTQGITEGGFVDLLSALETVLKDYGEISDSCLQMVEGLREISDHMKKIEDGRSKILKGVESILENLSQLDRLAKSGLSSGGSGTAPKRILLVRINPDNKPAPSLRDEDEEDEAPAGDTVVH